MELNFRKILKPCAIAFSFLSTAPAFADDNYLYLSTIEYPPYSSEKMSKGNGVVLDILTEALNRSGYQVQYNFLSYKRALAHAEDGRVDGMAFLFKNMEQEEQFLFPDQATYTIDMSICKNKNLEFAYDGTMQSLAGLKVGVVKGTALTPEFLKASQDGLFSVVELQNIEDQIQALRRGSVDVATAAKDAGKYEISLTAFQDELEVMDPIVRNNPTYLGLTKGQDRTDLFKKFETQLKAMYAEGRVAQISSKYKQ